MDARKFKPSSRYRSKLYLNVTLIALSIAAFGLLLGGLIAADGDVREGQVLMIIVLGIDALYWLIAMLLTGPYYNSLRYELHSDEIVVYVGIWTKSVKHVPFRTVTNVQTKRDIFDRWFFNIGSLNVQTAGMSGDKGAEEKLVGLPNVFEVYEMVATELRRFRGGMTPTAADVDPVDRGDDRVTSAMLDELRAIRKAVEKS
jgi:uncharacterized membrane protein YdbT with pleckstrin-like domain